MSKFFKEELKKEYPLSEFLVKEPEEFKGCIFTEEARQCRTKYIKEILGDISLDADTYKLFITQFQCFGGRYDVRTSKETIKGIYDISKRYPQLTAAALDEIWFTYIKDLFEEYALVDILEKYISIHGQTDDAIVAYLDFVARKAKEFDAPFKETAKELDKYKEEYGERFITHLQHLMRSRHIPLEQVVDSLPSPELIKKDQEQLGEISRATRIYMDVCPPISQQMTDTLAAGESLDCYLEQPLYIINGTRNITASFTKQEFLDSVEKQREIRKVTKPKQIKKI